MEGIGYYLARTIVVGGLVVLLLGMAIGLSAGCIAGCVARHAHVEWRK